MQVHACRLEPYKHHAEEGVHATFCVNLHRRPFLAYAPECRLPLYSYFGEQSIGRYSNHLLISTQALQLDSYCSPGVLVGHWLFASLPLVESPVWLPCQQHHLIC